MELVNWSLNAIDRIFSTRSSGSGEPVCPEGTFAAGYTMDSWEKWRVVCLAILSVEHSEDLYIFGTMITGYLLIGLGIALVYRGIRKTVSAVHSPTKLPDLIDGVSRAVSAQTVGLNRNMEITLEKAVSALTVVIHRKMDNILERAVNAQMVVINLNMENILERAADAQTVVINRNMENILEKFSALLRRMNRFEDQNGQIE